MKGLSQIYDAGDHRWLTERCVPTSEIYSLTNSFTPSITGFSTLSLQALHLLYFVGLALFVRWLRSKKNTNGNPGKHESNCSLSGRFVGNAL